MSLAIRDGINFVIQTSNPAVASQLFLIRVNYRPPGRNFLIFRLALIVLMLSGPVFAQSPPTISSPDGRLSITFRAVAAARPVAEGETSPAPEPAPDGGQLVYEVSFQGKALIEASALRLDLKDQSPLGPNVRIVNSTSSATDETYHLVAGKASSVRNHYNALRVELEEPAAPGRKLAMEARAYDDAVAFRYVVPEQPALREFRLAAERTEFRISKDPIIYALVLPNFRSMYESEFIKLSASSLSNQGGVESQVLVGSPAADGSAGRGLDGHHRGRPARLCRHVPDESVRRLDQPQVRVHACAAPG